MRQREALVLELDVAEEQHVHVDRAGPVARPGEDAAELDLDRLADVEELERLEVGGDARGGVQEVGLVEDLADRLGLVERRDGLDRDAVAAEQFERLRDVLGALADVGAKAEVAGPDRQSSSSSSGGSSGRSTRTSTETSSIASGSGGSGLVARTRTLSEP